jgi:hypothetical protein
MAKLSDTTPDAERVLTAVYRRMTPAQKWRLLGQAYQDARALHAAGLRLWRPAVTDREIIEDWVRRHFGVSVAARPRQREPMPNLKDFAEVAAVLDRLGIGYALGGSMACSVYGFSRQTNDAAVSVPPFPGREKELIEALGPDYYVSEDAIRQAIARRSSFNAINTATGFKVDFFVQPDEPFERSAWARRVALDVEDAAGRISVLSAEDVILYKLRWYRLGDESSEQQWKDVVSVARVQRPRLDEAYLRRWAGELRVGDLLDRLLAEVPAE